MSAQVAITQLPSAGPITGTEAVPIVQNGVTVQTTTGAISASPSQDQTFLTKNQEPTLPNSRYLSTTSGLTLTDGGAQSFYRIAVIFVCFDWPNVHGYMVLASIVSYSLWVPTNLTQTILN